MANACIKTVFSAVAAVPVGRHPRAACPTVMEWREQADGTKGAALRKKLDLYPVDYSFGSNHSRTQRVRCPINRPV